MSDRVQQDLQEVSLYEENIRRLMMADTTNQENVRQTVELMDKQLDLLTGVFNGLWYRVRNYAPEASIREHLPSIPPPATLYRQTHKTCESCGIRRTQEYWMGKCPACQK